MEILKDVTPSILANAKKLAGNKKFSINVHPHIQEFYVEVQLKTKSHSNICIISGSHTNCVYLEKNGKVIIDKRGEVHEKESASYKDKVRNLTLSELVDLAENIDEKDMEYLKKGIEMNMEIFRAGQKLKKIGWFMTDLINKKMLLDDIFSSTKVMVACAVDARMDGFPLPAMASGGSGNQGIVATLVPYNVGKEFKVDEKVILKSIALSHVLNSYIKCFTGDLAPICGCAIAAGVGAASAIVYQQKGKDIESITFAINNLISDLGGMLCDGAKSGCALKVVSSADAAIRSGYLGIHNYGITSIEGFIGASAEETIRNLNKITKIGMANMDDTIINIMLEKSRIGG
ncbi:MAG: L-serine ammonia-lyase, iron-sulfur-dependent, subunit alpha [Armatimonadota bacterium]